MGKPNVRRSPDLGEPQHERTSPTIEAVESGRGHRYLGPADAARTITALISLRARVIAPVLAYVRKPTDGR